MKRSTYFTFGGTVSRTAYPSRRIRFLEQLSVDPHVRQRPVVAVRAIHIELQTHGAHRPWRVRCRSMPRAPKHSSLGVGAVRLGRVDADDPDGGLASVERAHGSCRRRSHAVTLATVTGGSVPGGTVGHARHQRTRMPPSRSAAERHAVGHDGRTGERYRSLVDLGFAPDDLGFIADPYPVYAELRARAPRDVRRGHRPLADLAVRRRERAAARPPLRPHLPARPTPRGDGPRRSAARARGVLAPDQPRHPRHGAARSHPAASAGRRRRSPRGWSRASASPIQRFMDGLSTAVAGSGSFDLIADRRRAAAGGGDRRAARASPRPTGTCCGRGRPTSAACTSCIPPTRTQRWRVARSIEFSDYLRALSRERRARTDRRPHQRARAGRGRR